MVKVICGLVLIGGVAARFVFDVAPNLAVLSVPAAQIIVIVGGALYIWHYWIVSRNSRDMQTPSTLVRRGGLFPLIRHPMYFADLIYYTGLALLWSTHLALMVLLIAWLALLMQSRVEAAEVILKPVAQATLENGSIEIT